MTRLVLSVKSFTVCSTFHTACDIGDGLIFSPALFSAKETLAAEILRPPLFICGSIFVTFFKKRVPLGRLCI